MSAGYPSSAICTLAVLGARQPWVENPQRDAEPGKILHELRRGELAHFRTARRCLDRIDYWGDRNGDGLQECGAARPSEHGRKGCPRCVPLGHGRMASNPKELCEIQGYTSAAWLGMAEICNSLGGPARAAALWGLAFGLHRLDLRFTRRDGWNVAEVPSGPADVVRNRRRI